MPSYCRCGPAFRSNHPSAYASPTANLVAECIQHASQSTLGLTTAMLISSPCPASPTAALAGSPATAKSNTISPCCNRAPSLVAGNDSRSQKFSSGFNPKYPRSNPTLIAETIKLRQARERTDRNTVASFFPISLPFSSVAGGGIFCSAFRRQNQPFACVTALRRSTSKNAPNNRRLCFCSLFRLVAQNFSARYNNTIYILQLNHTLI